MGIVEPIAERSIFCDGSLAQDRDALYCDICDSSMIFVPPARDYVRCILACPAFIHAAEEHWHI